MESHLLHRQSPW